MLLEQNSEEGISVNACSTPVTRPSGSKYNGSSPRVTLIWFSYTMYSSNSSLYSSISLPLLRIVWNLPWKQTYCSTGGRVPQQRSLLLPCQKRALDTSTLIRHRSYRFRAQTIPPLYRTLARTMSHSSGTIRRKPIPGVYSHEMNDLVVLSVDGKPLPPLFPAPPPNKPLPTLPPLTHEQQPRDLDNLSTTAHVGESSKPRRKPGAGRKTQLLRAIVFLRVIQTCFVGIILGLLGTMYANKLYVQSPASVPTTTLEPIGTYLLTVAILCGIWTVLRAFAYLSAGFLCSGTDRRAKRNWLWGGDPEKGIAGAAAVEAGGGGRNTRKWWMSFALLWGELGTLGVSASLLFYSLGYLPPPPSLPLHNTTTTSAAAAAAAAAAPVSSSTCCFPPRRDTPSSALAKFDFGFGKDSNNGKSDGSMAMYGRAL
ncbi:hypothetical protein BD289DRAFT_142912 [Coniella lustricola]|uniref:Uncharacterized protein n=1 Tax=Coniella lustricola TaxID=2025994 RepID=A0A2T2ZV61_9PEZI|nr:hypothetical protein BD289DRAFT_142912 [Coniella lustricola]